MSGGKGGSKSQEVKIPEWAKNFAISNLERAQDASKIGYMPWFGPDVAEVNSAEMAANQNVNAAAGALGLAGGGNPFSGLGEAQEFAGGLKGYSSAPLLMGNLETLEERAPGAMQMYRGLFESNVPEGVNSMYFDPSNPDHLAAREAEAEAAQSTQYPPGYEWLALLQNRSGGFR